MLLQIKPPQANGPDTRDGYGCDNMSVLIVRLKPALLRRSGALSGLGFRVLYLFLPDLCPAT